MSEMRRGEAVFVLGDLDDRATPRHAMPSHPEGHRRSASACHLAKDISGNSEP